MKARILFLLYALVLISLSLISFEYAAVSWEEIGSREAGALSVVFWQLGFIYFAFASAQIALYFKKLSWLDKDKNQLVSTFICFSWALPLSILFTTGPLATGLIALLLGMMPSILYLYFDNLAKNKADIENTTTVKI